MAVSRDFLVKLFADPKQIISAFNKVQGEAESTFGKGGLGGKLSNLLPSFKTIAIAGTAAFGAITAAAGFAIKAAAEDAEGQAKLARQLEATTGATKSQIEEVERQIGSLSRAASVADDELRPAFENLVRGTGDITQAQKLLSLAVDISAGSSRDLSSVSIALSRAANGNFTALTRLGIPLDENAVKTKNLNSIVKQLDGQFAGAAATSADTFAGKMRGLRIGIDELNEKVGELLLPYIETFVDFLKDNLVPAVDLAITKFKGSGSFSDAVAFLVGGLGGLGPAAINAFRVVGNTAIDTTQILLRTYGVIAALGGGFRAIASKGKDLSGITTAASGFAALLGSAGLGVAQEKFNKSLDNLAKNAKRAAEIINAPLNPAIVGANERLDGFGGKVKRVSGDLEGLGDEVEKTGGKVESATKKLTRADKIKEFTKVLKDATDASEDFGRAQDRVKQSGESLAEADLSLADAQKALAKAQQGGSQAEIADATRAVAAAQRSQARAGFNIEQAVIRVAEAEAELKKIRLDPESSSAAIRLAEIALAEAKFAVADSEDSQASSAKTLSDARDALRITTSGLRDGEEALIPFQDAVTKAMKDQKKASEDNAKAIEDEAKILDLYIEALKELAKVKVLFPKVAGGIDSVTGLIPIPPAAPNAGNTGGGQMLMSDKVEITVTSAIINPLQVAQEIQDYLDQLNRSYGTYRP